MLPKIIIYSNDHGNCVQFDTGRIARAITRTARYFYTIVQASEQRMDFRLPAVARTLSTVLTETR